ncbi:MAG: hypothetical protein VKK62_02450 [Synechococcaceae cyanobacterium]|nr:hypothetical protein [Synechococcaceae cyanobacterium]
MGPLHCPLCIGLAILSLLRTATQATLLWRLFGPRPAVGGIAPQTAGPGLRLARQHG